MLKKTIFAGLMMIFLASNVVKAEYNDDELPVWGMLNETAYTLNKGEWNIDLWGPITYGITDQLQVGSIFWVWFAQIPNVYAKYNLIQEGSGVPAISLGGFYRNFSFDINNEFEDNAKVSVNWYGVQAVISKEISEKLYVSAGYIYNGIDISGSFSSSDDSFIFNFSGTGSSNQLMASLVTQMSKSTSFSTEVVADITEDGLDFSAGGGFEWAMGKTFRLKLGVQAFIRDNLVYIPFLDFHWRFK